jgi:hypothetical protein
MTTTKAKFTVLAVPHELQGPKFQRYVDDNCYREIVDMLIKGHRKIDTIFEEAAGCLPTHAQDMANARSIPFVDVDPPVKERTKYGLAECTGESGPVDPINSTCSMRTEFAHEHIKRELHWISQIESRQFKSGLLICGMSHGQSMATRLIDLGYDLEDVVTHNPYEKLCRHIALLAVQR